MPTPPVINNKESEIKGCSVNLTWSPPPRQACPVNKYTIFYREKTSDEYEADWTEKRISQVSRTSHVIRLFCDSNYEIAMSTLIGKRESSRSTSWQVRTNSGASLIYSEGIHSSAGNF